MCSRWTFTRTNASFIYWVFQWIMPSPLGLIKDRREPLLDAGRGVILRGPDRLQHLQDVAGSNGCNWALGERGKGIPLHRRQPDLTCPVAALRFYQIFMDARSCFLKGQMFPLANNIWVGASASGLSKRRRCLPRSQQRRMGADLGPLSHRPRCTAVRSTHDFPPAVPIRRHNPSRSQCIPGA